MRMRPFELFQFGLAVVGTGAVGWAVFGVGCIVRTWWRGWLAGDSKERRR
jgi:hypothetical protein